MKQNLKDNEREIVKLIHFFKKRSEKLIEEGKLGPEHAEVSAACDRLLEQIESHAELREVLLLQRKQLESMITDQAVCPSCNSGSMLKLSGAKKNDKGWRCNVYRCRKCNIEFIWNRPNNPWDMILFFEEQIGILENTLSAETTDEGREHTNLLLEQLRHTLNQFKPVLESHDDQFNSMMTRDEEMSKMINESRKFLLIEKIKMED